MTDSIKLADLPQDALSAIATSPSALDSETLDAVVKEFERRAEYMRAHAVAVRKYVAARRGDHVIQLAPGQR